MATSLTCMKVTCGIPYQKLIPIANETGSKYSLLVVATDYDQAASMRMSGSDFNYLNSITAPRICGAHLASNCKYRDVVDSKALKYPIYRLGWISKFDESTIAMKDSMIATSDFEVMRPL